MLLNITEKRYRLLGVASVLLLLALTACGGGGLSAPANLELTAGPGSITLTWTDRAQNEDGYVVYRKSAETAAALSGEAFAVQLRLAANTETYTDQDVEPDLFYAYQVTAVRGEEESPPAVQRNPVQPDPPEAILSVSFMGDGLGTLTSDPPGLECAVTGDTCEASYVEGTTVTLTASAGENSGFSGWGGPCEGRGTCEIELLDNTRVEVRFERTDFVLEVTLSGEVEGTVTSTPSGIACGPANEDCSATFPKGTIVSMEAVPATGATFAGWEGACSGNGLCFVTLEKDISVTAVFTYPPPKIDSFIANPGSILNGQSARLEWTVTGQAVSSLSIAPNVGEITDLSQTSAVVRPSDTTTYTLTAASEYGTTKDTVTVQVRPSARLEVQVQGNGTVESTQPINVIVCSSSGGSSSGDCLELFDLNTTVVLEATDGNLINWTGCDSVQGNQCTLSLSANRTVTASFGSLLSQ